MSKKPFRHDLFFKHSFQIKEIVQEHIQFFLPLEISQHIDLNTLELDQTDYVDKSLKEARSDIIYTCQLKKGGNLRIALLHEHKSQQPSRDIRIQILNYKTNIWRVDEKQNRPITFVLPIVIYHGKRPWQEKRFIGSFPDLPDSYYPFLSDFDYLLINLKELSDEEILRKSEGKLIASAFLALKNAFTPDYFKQNFLKVLNFEWTDYSKSTWETFLGGLLSYISSLTNFKKDDFQTLSKNLPQPLNYYTMITMESIREEAIKDGFKQGKEKGIAEGLEQGKLIAIKEKERQFVLSMLKSMPQLSDAKIAELVEVKKSYVAKLRKELKKTE